MILLLLKNVLKGSSSLSIPLYWTNWFKDAESQHFEKRISWIVDLLLLDILVFSIAGHLRGFFVNGSLFGEFCEQWSWKSDLARAKTNPKPKMRIVTLQTRWPASRIFSLSIRTSVVICVCESPNYPLVSKSRKDDFDIKSSLSF